MAPTSVSTTTAAAKIAAPMNAGVLKELKQSAQTICKYKNAMKGLTWLKSVPLLL